MATLEEKGAEVFNHDPLIGVEAGENTLRLSTAGVPAGFYLLTVREGGLQLVRKVLIHNR